MHLIPFKGRNTSTYYNLNLLFQNGKTYIMDNHLAASWCWLQQIDIEKQYNLLHIDRHYDLLQSQIEWWIEALQVQNIDLTSISITDLLSIRYEHKQMRTFKSQLFRFDNYLTIFLRLFPYLIDTAIFATHKDKKTTFDIPMLEPEIDELKENLSAWINCNSNNKWIVNLDIDYFFKKDIKQERVQFLTDSAILKIAEEIRKSWDNIEVLTIALSPEYSGGWDSAERVARLITEHLEVSWAI